MDFLAIVGAFAGLLLFGFAAFGCDERDNMRGDCKAAAMCPPRGKEGAKDDPLPSPKHIGDH